MRLLRDRPYFGEELSFEPGPVPLMFGVSAISESMASFSCAHVLWGQYEVCRRCPRKRI